MQSVPVFLINLDRRPDRLAQMRSEFQGVGVQFERVPAVDAKNPDQDLDEWRVDPRISTGPATLCNLLSHLKVMRRIVADGIPLAMVMEDDAELSPDVLKLVSCSDWLPKEPVSFNAREARAAEVESVSSDPRIQPRPPPGAISIGCIHGRWGQPVTS